MPHRQTDERHNPYGNVDLEYGHQETGTTAPDFHENPLPPSQHYGGRHHHPHATVLANPVFLARIESVRKDIEDLSIYITQISTLHQRAVTSTDSSTSAAIENTVAQTQVLNTTIRDQIRYLEIDAARSGGNVVKNSQIRNIKNQFKNRIDQFQQEEVTYRARYQEQIARQYLVIHPDANEAEIREAAEADWGDEGIFQAALNSNRSRTATSVLGAVRARHRDIQNIERTLIELNQLLQDLAEVITIQDDLFKAADLQTEHVVKDTRGVNTHLDKSIQSARRTRKLKWCCCIFMLFLIIVIAVALIIYFKVLKPKQDAAAASGGQAPSSSTVGFAGP